MSRDPTLLDTNVLIYALYKDSGYFPAARALLDQAKQEDAGFCITPQVLAEFYAVVTHGMPGSGPTAFNGYYGDRLNSHGPD